MAPTCIPSESMTCTVPPPAFTRRGNFDIGTRFDKRPDVTTQTGYAGLDRDIMRRH